MFSIRDTEHPRFPMFEKSGIIKRRENSNTQFGGEYGSVLRLSAMRQKLVLTSILVDDYDKAIDFYVNILEFNLIEDTTLVPATATEPAKRWVVVRPAGARESGLLLAYASNAQQQASVGGQCGGRVFLFLHTDDFWRDYHAYQNRGVKFVGGEPREEPYGTVAVFVDVAGNKWDLIEPRIDTSAEARHLR